MTESLTGSPRPGHLTLRGSPFPPIAEYGFLSDCEASALVAASGNVEWMCLPRMEAFSHLALINAVMHVIDGDERLSTGGPPATGLEAGAGAAAASDEASS